MITQTDVTELAAAYGWTDLGLQKAPMWSYRHEEKGIRMNVYYTTGTVSFQKASMTPSYHRDVATLEDFERLFGNYGQ